jgi:hypothetical protein
LEAKSQDELSSRIRLTCLTVYLELAVINEALAYGLIGNSVPVATMGAFLRQAINAILKVLPAVEVGGVSGSKR